MAKGIHAVVFWGAGATHRLGMPLTKEQDTIFFSLSQKTPETDYRECLQKHEDVFGDCLDDICDLLTLLDDDPNVETEKGSIGYRMSGFSKRQLRIIDKHAKVLGDEQRKRINRVIMMRLRYDWAAVMRILRLQRFNVKDKNHPADTFTQTIYNLIDSNIAAGTGVHIFDENDSVLSNFIDAVRLKAAKSALVMFVNLMLASAWAKNRCDFRKLEPYMRFGDLLAKIRAKEASDTIREGMVPHRFNTAFVSMNFDPLLWWIIKNADAKYNKTPIYIGDDRTPLYLGEDVDQVDAIRPFSGVCEGDNGILLNETLLEQVAEFINKHGYNQSERCLARYQTVKIFFPHGSPNLKICPCCGKTTLYQGNELSENSRSLFPPFFFNGLSWGSIPSRVVRDDCSHFAEHVKWGEGERDNIQCRHCGRSIRMCDTEMVMQSGLKMQPSFLLQRISHNVDNAVMNASHIILMGYSLPPDDGAWVAELQARTTRENECAKAYCSVIGHSEDTPNHWLYSDELDDFLKRNPNAAVENARRVFGVKCVRAHLKGIPDVFEDEESVRELLYPIKWIGSQS